MRKDIRSSTSPKALAASFPMPTPAEAMDEVRLSVDRFCLLAGVEALAEMWVEETLDAYFANPAAVMPGTELTGPLRNA